MKTLVCRYCEKVRKENEDKWTTTDEDLITLITEHRLNMLVDKADKNSYGYYICPKCKERVLTFKKGGSNEEVKENQPTSSDP
jgi:retron-type reverse transcriptase